MKKLVVMAAALLLSTPAFAQTIGIGGGVGVVGLQSMSGGSVQGGGFNGGATALAGVTASQTTQTAATTGLAGTRLSMTPSGTSLVSEHNVTGGSQQTTVGSSLGGAFSGGAGSSSFLGSSMSQGTFGGVQGFLGVGLTP